MHGWVVCFVLLLVSCHREQVGATDERLEATVDSIQRNFVNRHCLECHLTATAANRYVSLSDLSTLIEKTGDGHSHHPRFLIKPGCPRESFFLSILKEGKMPPAPAQKVSAEAINTIERWIISLHPNGSCDDEPQDTSGGGDEP